MRLSATFLINVGDVNTWQETSQLQMTEGDAVTVYFQLRDVSVATACDAYKNPVGRRYMPAVGATVVARIDTLNDANVAALTKTCFQPFSQDPSIWAFQILSTDPVSGTKRMKITVTEGLKVTNGIVNSALLVSPTM